MKTNKLYEFENFRIDAGERVLISENEIVPLAPKVFETLFLLVERRGNIVSKDELMNNIWSDSFVEEGNLTQNIYTLRQTLGKDFIETVPRRGYRFAKPVAVKSLDSKSENFENANGNYIVATRTRTSLIEETSIEDNEDFPKPERRSFSTLKTYIGLVFAAVFLFALGFVGYNYFQNQTANTSPKIFANFEFERLTDTGNVYSPAISPDGKFIAYLKRDADGQSLRLKDVASGNDVELNIKNNVKPELLQFSPDGKHIFFRTEGRVRVSREIYRISYFGGSAELVAENAWGAFSLSPDGKHIAFYRYKPTANKEFIVIKNFENKSEKEFAARVLPKNIFMSVYPAWSADGEKLAFIPLDGRSNRSRIGFLDIETGREKIINTGKPNIRQSVFLPDDRHLLFVARDKAFQIFRLDYTNSEIEKITNDLNNYRNLSITADGTKVVTQQRKLKSNLWLVPDGNLDQAEALTEEGHYALLDLAALDNGKILFDSKGKINRKLQINDIKKGTQMALSENKNMIRAYTPAADIEGNTIYFVSNKSGSPNIWRVNSDGTNLKQITFGKENELNTAPSLSPDGKWLYYVKKLGGLNSVWRKSTDGKEKPEEIFRAEDFSFGLFSEISPDGEWLAFHYIGEKQNPDKSERDFSKMTKIGFLSLSDKKHLKIFEIKTNRPRICWTNGGKTFDYQGTREERKIWRQDFNNQFAPPETVFQIPQERIIHFDWSPDEKNLVIARGKHLSDAVMLKTAE